MKQKSAFTLVELLTVIAIIGILSTILLSSLSSHKTLKEIEGAMALLSSVLRETQNSALTGQQLVADTTPCLYQVNYGGGAITAYYFWKDASNNCSNSVVTQNTALPAGVTVTNGGTVYFVPPYGNISQDFTILFSKLGTNSVLCLYMSGRIETVNNSTTCP